MKKTELWRSALSPSYMTWKCKQEAGGTNDNITETFAKDTKIRLLTLCFMMGRPELSFKQFKGLLHFVGVVSLSDDVIDKANMTGFSNRDTFKDFLMNQEIQIVGQSTSIQHLLSLTHDQFVNDKKEIIDPFLDYMITLHWQGAGKGKPGEYGVQDVLEYRDKTNIPLGVAALGLLDIPKQDIDETINRMKPTGDAIQLFDDRIDWRQDLGSNTLNAFIGISNDSCEVSRLTEVYNQGAKSDRGIYSQGLEKTRKGYRALMDNRFQNMENSLFKSSLMLAGKLLVRK